MRILERIRQIAVEYHDQIVPGTLYGVRSALAHMQDISISPSGVEGCGILRAQRRSQYASPAQ
jgi:hypothetical protein